MADSPSQLRILQEKLKEAEQRAEQERQRAEQERQRAEQERQRAEQADSRAEEAEEQARRTTLEELLESCHYYLSEPISVQKNKSLSTQGSTTSPKGKRCPTMLQPWTEFPGIQQQAFDEVYNALHPTNATGPRLFSPQLHIQELGHTTQGRMIASEEDLKMFEHTTVENFVADIFSVLANNHQYSEDLDIGHGVVFENHSNTLSDLEDNVQALLHPSTSSSNPRRAPKPIHADQLCVYKSEDGQKELLYIIEYKAPHKLTKEILRVGLRAMDLPTEVVHRPTIPIDPQEKFNYNAEKLVAAAVTQPYSYMLESGAEYSCIITGEAIVFLWIKEDDSNTLYYHLAEPNEQVRKSDGLGFQHPLTAISQQLSFCLMALRSKRRSQLWRDRSIGQAQTWCDDWEKILRDIPYEQRKLDPPPSSFKARIYPINVRSPYHLRKRAPRPSVSSCSAEHDTIRNDCDEPPEGPGDGPESISTPSKEGRPGASTRQGGSRRRGRGDSSAAGNQQHPYCTQRCLLGLVQRFALDECCPNVRFHRQGKKRRTHMLNKEQFSELIQRQLATDLDRNVKELKQQGLRGALFRITLASHGYTFVGKATREVYVPALQHEGRIYGRLRRIQGKRIPVYLGNIDLERPWYDLHVRLVHMLLMSWGGERANEVKDISTLQIEIYKFEDEIKRLGVRHNDIISDNILWNDEVHGMMFIDFEGSTESRGRALQEVSNNRKRKRGVEGEEVIAQPRAKTQLRTAR